MGLAVGPSAHIDHARRSLSRVRPSVGNVPRRHHNDWVQVAARLDRPCGRANNTRGSGAPVRELGEAVWMGAGAAGESV